MNLLKKTLSKSVVQLKYNSTFNQHQCRSIQQLLLCNKKIFANKQHRKQPANFNNINRISVKEFSLTGLSNKSDDFAAVPNIQQQLIDSVQYETICSETLEALCDYFDELVESATHLNGADITYSRDLAEPMNYKRNKGLSVITTYTTNNYSEILHDGVLTIKFGNACGTYVINRQSPNRQIWLSSPTSGPKRYDFVPTTIGNDGLIKNGHWIYKHEQITLHELLQKEIAEIVRKEVDFMALPYGKR